MRIGPAREGSLYLCTPIREDLLSFVAACLEGGIDVVQIRDKAAGDEEILMAAESVRVLTQEYGALLIINDRPDLASKVGADGAHIGQEDMDPRAARNLLKDGILGLSTHSIAQIEKAQKEPVDYISVGPVVPTPTKPGRPGIGLEPVRYAARHSSLPFFVTGNVRPETVEELFSAGARNFVVVRYLTQADDPLRAAKALRRAVDALLEGL